MPPSISPRTDRQYPVRIRPVENDDAVNRQGANEPIPDNEEPTTQEDLVRHLVSAQKIESLTPIKDADRIEVARVQGWNVVVPKDQFEAGDTVAYFETDSLLPAGDPRYEGFQKRGQKTVAAGDKEFTGHVLKTMKLRGQISQGLVMSLEEVGADTDVSVGTDLTEVAGVVKYEEPIPDEKGIKGHFDTRKFPKSKAQRLQSLSDHWEEIHNLEWTPTVKVDGTSQTLANEDGKLRLFGRNWELDPEIAPGFAVLQKQGIPEVLVPGMTVQFELCGPGIGNNRLRLPELRAFVFAVYFENEKVPRSQWPEGLLASAVPELDADTWGVEDSLDKTVEKVSGIRETIAKGAADEGIVYHLAEGQDVPVWLDRNQNFKVINNKYLLKYGL